MGRESEGTETGIGDDTIGGDRDGNATAVLYPTYITLFSCKSYSRNS